MRLFKWFKDLFGPHPDLLDDTIENSLGDCAACGDVVLRGTAAYHEELLHRSCLERQREWETERHNRSAVFQGMFQTLYGPLVGAFGEDIIEHLQTLFRCDLTKVGADAFLNNLERKTNDASLHLPQRRRALLAIREAREHVQHLAA